MSNFVLIMSIMFSVSKQRFHIVSFYVPSDCNHSNVIDCWDLKGASVEKCGQMFPSPPQNLTVTGTPVNQSSIMLYISWRPPVHYAPDIEAYEISINGNYYCSNGVSTIVIHVVATLQLMFIMWIRM